MLFKRKKSLIISEDLAPVLTQQETEKLCELQNELVEDYLQHRDEMSMEEWLNQTLSKNLPNATPEQIKQDSEQTLETLRIKEDKLQDLTNYREKGMSSSHWFAKEMKEQTKGMSQEDRLNHLHTIAQGVEEANRQVFNGVNMRASLDELGINSDEVYDGAQNLVARFNQDATNKQTGYHAVLDNSQVSAETPYGQINVLDRQGQVVDSYDVQYEHVADSEADWDKYNVYNNPTIANTLNEGIEVVSEKIGVDPDKAKRVVESVSNPEKLGETLKDIAVDKGAEIISEKLGVERGTINKVIDIVSASDPAEEAKQVVEEMVVEKAVNVVTSSIDVSAKVSDILGPDLTSSGKYVNMPWGNTYGPDINKAPEGGWTNANIKDRAMWICDEISANSTLNLGCGNVVNMTEKAFEKIKPSESTNKAVAALLDKGDLKGLKTATAAAIQIGVGTGKLPSIVPKVKTLPVPCMTLMADLAVSKGHDITHAATNVLIDRTIGDHIVASTATIGQIGGQAVGKSIGAAVGTVLGPVGTVVGSVLGAGIGWIAGAGVGKAICNTIKTVACKVVDGIKNTVKSVVSGAISVVKAVGSTICSAVGAVTRGVGSFIGGAFRAVGSVFSGICSAVGSFFSCFF